MAKKLKFCCTIQEPRNPDEIYRTVNFTIRNIFDNAIAEISELPDNFKSKQSRVFLRHIKFFKDHVIWRIKTLPEDAEMRNNYYKKLWRDNRIIRDELKS